MAAKVKYILHSNKYKHKSAVFVVMLLVFSGCGIFKQPPPRTEWDVSDFVRVTQDIEKGRNFERGQAAYAKGQCMTCHRFKGVGGSFGPDLTIIGERLSTPMLLESILKPDRVIPDLFINRKVLKTDGTLIIGRFVRGNLKQIELWVEPLSKENVKILRSEIQEIKRSYVSPMPGNLVDTFSREEVLDLIAFLKAGGQRDNPMFKQADTKEK